MNCADIAAYAKVLGVELKIDFEPRAESAAKRSEWLVYQIDGLLTKLKRYVADADLFQKAVDDFSGRALFPVLRQAHSA